MTLSSLFIETRPTKTSRKDRETVEDLKTSTKSQDVMPYGTALAYKRYKDPTFDPFATSGRKTKSLIRQIAFIT